MAERSLLQRFDQAGPLTWLLAAGAGWSVLLWIAALLGMGGQLDEAIPAAAETSLPQARPAAPDRIGPLAQYAEAASRPLFTQDRRPRSFMATGPEGDNVATSQSLDFILTGVLISPQVQLAVLQPSGGGDAQRVRVGSSPEGGTGWRLVEVQPRRAIFEGGGGQSALDLRTFGEAGGPTATAVARPQATPAVANVVPPPPPRPQAADEPQDQEARIEAIRKRIEARRAQMRAGQTGSGASPTSSTPPPKP